MNVTRLVLPVAVALTLSLACGGGSDATNTPTSSAVPSAVTRTDTPNPTLTLENQIGEAYLAYWDAYSQALLNLDASAAEGFASGDQLQRIRDEITNLQAQGVAERVVVEHHYAVVQATATSATVSDNIVNNSFFVDPVTKDPPSAAGSGERFTDTYQMEKVGDRWLVVNGSRQSSP